MKTILLPAKLLFYNLSRRIDKTFIYPMSFTYSLNSECGLRCKTCNMWKRKTANLSGDEWLKIIQSIGSRPYWITVTGGNPFLRKDFSDIMQYIVKYNKPRIINFPVSGAYPETVVEKMRKVLEAAQGTNIIANVSIDGVGSQHDRLRGRKGDFDKTLQTYFELRKLQKDHTNLSLCTYTVVSKHNVKYLDNITKFIKQLGPDNYSFEIAERREELCNMRGNFGLTKEQCLGVLGQFLGGRQKSRGTLIKLKSYLRSGYYLAVRENLLEGKIMRCFAGIASVHISSDGQLWNCSTKARVMGNLKNQDFGPAFFGERAGAIRKESKLCSCWLSNAYYTNRLCSLVP
jgi:MoaA/NifB/PqqE/SkfB family radical SAM enzyme